MINRNITCCCLLRTPDCVARVKSLTKCCLNDTNLERMPNEIGWLVRL